jgi:lipopolysaccharide export LptBFGC system permease protein LptF
MRTRLIVAFIVVALLAALAATWFNNLIGPYYNLPPGCPVRSARPDC